MQKREQSAGVSNFHSIDMKSRESFIGPHPFLVVYISGMVFFSFMQIMLILDPWQILIHDPYEFPQVGDLGEAVAPQTVTLVGLRLLEVRERGRQTVTKTF